MPGQVDIDRMIEWHKQHPRTQPLPPYHKDYVPVTTEGQEFEDLDIELEEPGDDSDDGPDEADFDDGTDEGYIFGR